MASGGHMETVLMKGIGCQEILRYDDVILHGTLRLRNFMNKLFDKITKQTTVPGMKWPRVYVVIHRACIYIFKNETSESASEAYSLYRFTAAVADSDEICIANVSWPFKITRQLDLEDKVLYFSSPSQLEMQKWVQTINSQAELAGGRGSRFSLPENNPGTRPRLPLPASEVPPLPPYDPATSEAFDSDDSEYDKVVELNDTDDDKDNKRKNSSPQPGQTLSWQRKPKVAHADKPNSLIEEITNIKLKPLPKPVPLPSQYDDAKEYIPTAEYVDGKACVPPVPAKPKQADSMLMKAFWSKSAEEGERMMKSITQDGVFMIRDSKDSASHPQTLLIRTDKMIRKFRIKKNEVGSFSLQEEGPWFTSLVSLIQNYRREYLPRLQFKLTQPWSEVANA